MAFRRHYRGPIEKQRDEACQARLNRRLAPFILRRTKSQVAAELPPKTEITRRVARQVAREIEVTCTKMMPRYIERQVPCTTQELVPVVVE